MSVRAEHPLAVAFGFFVGAIVADLLLIGGDVWAQVAAWRSGR